MKKKIFKCKLCGEDTGVYVITSIGENVCITCARDIERILGKYKEVFI